MSQKSYSNPDLYRLVQPKRESDFTQEYPTTTYGATWAKSNPAYNKFFAGDSTSDVKTVDRFVVESTALIGNGLYDEYKKQHEKLYGGLKWDNHGNRKEEEVSTPSKRFYVINGEQVEFEVPERWNIYGVAYTDGFKDAIDFTNDEGNEVAVYDLELTAEAYMAGWQAGMEVMAD